MADIPLSPLAPPGFPDMPGDAGVRLGAIEAGVRYTARADVMMAVLPEGTAVAGVFTRSTTPGAPVIWSKRALAETGGRARALVVNAGNANVFTGDEGVAAAGAVARAAGMVTGCHGEEVLVASTGVIGERLPFDRIIDALPKIVLSENVWEDAARAIMTTDTFPKGATATAEVDGDRITINGIAKGSGMIEPDMATMLAYVFTDAVIDPAVLDVLLRESNEESFNAITVDGDTSTSDMVLLFATGTAQHALITDAADPRLADFKAALKQVMIDLAQQVVRDGEGASKFITVRVSGAADDAAAKRVAKSIANSPLVKTAIAGEDANWGRVVMAVGKAYERVDPERLVVAFGGQPVTDEGRVRDGYDEASLTAHLQGQDIDLSVDLGIGDGEATVWTCDFTHGYISINADYRS